MPKDLGTGNEPMDGQNLTSRLINTTNTTLQKYDSKFDKQFAQRPILKIILAVSNFIEYWGRVLMPQQILIQLYSMLFIFSITHPTIARIFLDIKLLVNNVNYLAIISTGIILLIFYESSMYIRISCRSYFTINKINPKNLTEEETSAIRWLTKLNTYIETNMMEREKLLVPALAEHMKCRQRALSPKIKSITSAHSTRAYVREYRLRLADMELRREGYTKIEAVAREHGFTPESFSSGYKELFNNNPKNVVSQ